MNKNKAGAGVANPTNKLASELTNARRNKRGTKSDTILYQEYINHPTAQFTMSFSQYKRKNRSKRD